MPGNAQLCKSETVSLKFLGQPLLAMINKKLSMVLTASKR